MRSFLRIILQFLSELRRRNVYQVAVTYVLVGVFVIEAADLTLTRLGLPGWTVTLVIALVGLGFPIALVLAWALEMTPERVRVEETAAEETEGSEEVPAPSSTTRDLWVGASVLVLLLLGAWWMWGGLGNGEATDQAETEAPKIQDRSIAVLPFEVSGAGAEEWRDGMVTALSLNLDGAAGLRAVSDRTVFAAWQKQDSAEVGASVEDALSVARNIGARYALVGSALQLGGELRLGAEVRDAASGDQLGQVEVRGSPDSVTALADRLTRKVLGILLEKSEEQVPSVDLASITTSSLEALKSYLAGERHFRASEYEAAVEDFRAATRHDSAFALASTRLARSLGWLGDIQEAQRAFSASYEHSGRLPERERRIAQARRLRFVHTHHLAAADSLRALTKIYPDDPTVWYELGEVLFHGSVPGGWPEAEPAFQRAIELDPGLAQYHHHPVQLAFIVHHDSALAARRIRAHPAGGYKQAYRLALDLVFGSAEKQEEALARLASGAVDRGNVITFALTFSSPRDGALQERVLRRLREREATRSGSLATLLVANSLRRGQITKATARLQKMELAPVPIGPAHLPSCDLAGEVSLGTSLPASVLRPYLDPSRIREGASARRLMCAGLYLIETGRTGTLPALIERVQAAGSEQGGPASKIERLVREIRGYRAVRAENLRRAERLWSGHNEVGHWGALWRGDLYRKLGQLETAEGWYLAAWQHPVTHERLGRLYEKMGKPKEAVAAYKRFITAWKNADGSLQDRVREARRRLEALGEKPAAE